MTENLRSVPAAVGPLSCWLALVGVDMCWGIKYFSIGVVQESSCSELLVIDSEETVGKNCQSFT